MEDCPSKENFTWNTAFGYRNDNKRRKLGWRADECGVCGTAPGFPGVLQINITVPQNAPTGNTVSLIVRSADGTVISNAATIAVQ